MFSSVAGTRSAFKKAVSLGAALLPFNTACDITSTTENANPSVRIEEIVVDGYDPATANVFIHATDPDSKQNRQLSHGDYFLNGTKEGTVSLSGSDVRTSFRLPRLSPTEYSLEIIVYDRAGASGTTFEHFTVSSEPRRVTAEVYVNRTHGIGRVTEGELCLSDDCAPINSEGIARFDSLSSGGNVVVKIPEHYHPMFMVSLGERRLDLSGIKTFAPAGSNRFTQNPLSKEALLHEVVEEDLIAMRLYSMYGPGTFYLTTAEIEAGLLNHPGRVAFSPSFEQRF